MNNGLYTVFTQPSYASLAHPLCGVAAKRVKNSISTFRKTEKGVVGEAYTR
jgi:hypothetical protein